MRHDQRPGIVHYKIGQKKDGRYFYGCRSLKKSICNEESKQYPQGKGIYVKYYEIEAGKRYIRTRDCRISTIIVKATITVMPLNIYAYSGL